MSEQNKQMVRRTFEAIWNRGDFAVIDARSRQKLIVKRIHVTMYGKET